MFKTALSGKTGSVVVDYDANESLFNAIVIKTNADGRLETTRIKDTDPYLMYKQIRHELANEKLSALAMKKFVRNMGSEIRVLSAQRRAFLSQSKGDFAKVRAMLAKAKAEKKKTAGKNGKAPAKGTKVVKKGATKKASSKKTETEVAEA